MDSQVSAKISIGFQGRTVAWADPDCRFDSAPIVIFKSEHDLRQVWILPGLSMLESSKLPVIASLNDFRLAVRSKVPDVDPYSLLRREQLDFLRSNDPGYLAELPKIDLVLNRKVGLIRPMNCLEALLFGFQADRQLMLEKPSEFSAMILRSARSDEVKIYFETEDRPGIRPSQKVVEMIEADLASGWTSWRHLHNHNFFVDHPVSIMGGVCPSRSDVQMYRWLRTEWAVRSASITNGFSTIDLTADDFDKLNVE